MNPSDTKRVQTFTNEVVLPAFAALKAKLETPERIITLIQSTENIPETVADVVHQMHPETPYLTSTPSPSSPTQSWIVASLCVEVVQQLATESVCVGQYCLSIEINPNPSGQIQTSSIVYAKSKAKPRQIQRSRLEDDDLPLALEEIDESDITLQFSESFDAFECYCLAVEPPLTAVEPPSTLDTLQSEPEPEQLFFPETSPILQPPISEPPFSPTPSPQSTVAQADATVDNKETIQRQQTQTLLSYLKINKTSFRHLWAPDFARGSDLAQKIVHHRPEQESDHQQAYDLLSQQATEFAWSFKPNMLSEFADYFELYWTMAERESTFTSTQENRPYPETFITQVHEWGEPDNLGKAKADIANPLRSLVRSIGLKFGRPDAQGQRDWIGYGTMHSTKSVEQMPQMIQVLNEQRRVLFETLSWGILQVYRNAEQLPPIEHKLGRNLVLSYLISGRLTIKNPTQAIERITSTFDGYEFQFQRLIEDDGQSWMATAWVQVSQLRCVNLYRYEFEAL